MADDREGRHGDALFLSRSSVQVHTHILFSWIHLRLSLRRHSAAARQSWADGHKANKFNPWAKRCKEMLDLVAAGGEVPRTLAS